MTDTNNSSVPPEPGAQDASADVSSGQSPVSTPATAPPTVGTRATADAVAAMPKGPARRKLVRPIGSLWLGGVLLVTLAVAMGCATVYEAEHGRQAALVRFYQSWWFIGLLALTGVNILASLINRWPTVRNMGGFYVSHVGLLIVLIGAWVSSLFGINGQVRIQEGGTAENFVVPGGTLTAVAMGPPQQSAEVVLDSPAFRKLDPVDHPRAPELAIGDLRVEVAQFLPDAVLTTQVLGDGKTFDPAVQILLQEAQDQFPIWLFAGEPTSLGRLGMSLKVVEDATTWQELLAVDPDDAEEGLGTIKLEIAEQEYEFALEDCQDAAVPVGDTGYQMQVVEYLPRARVGEGGLTNAPNGPFNPAVRVQITDPEGEQSVQPAFARVPDFAMMHGGQQAVRVNFVSNEQGSGSDSLELLWGPEQQLAVRFAAAQGKPVVHVGPFDQPIETPWPGVQFKVGQKFPTARRQTVAQIQRPPREMPTPVLQLQLTENGNSGAPPTLEWLEKFEPKTLQVAGKAYRFRYVNHIKPLGFRLRVQDFEMGTYPGTSRPRSFTSYISIEDDEGSIPLERVVSMNKPVSHGGYTLFQSSYEMGRGNMPDATVLSVASDPGQTVVFVGYVTTFLGMGWGLAFRMRQQRRKLGRSMEPDLRSAGSEKSNAGGREVAHA
jgi:hypothetical protein